MPTLDPAVIALIATLFGGVGLKVVEHWFGKSKTRIDEAGRLREEYRAEIIAQREEIKRLEDDVDIWREKYYEEARSFTIAKTEAMIELEAFKRQAERAEAALRALDPQIPN